MQTEKQLPAVLPPKGFQITSLEDAKQMGQLFVDAGLFKVSDKEASAGVSPQQKAAVATVKIIAGAGLGLSPFAAMKGLHVIKDKVEPGYQTLLALVEQHPEYDYKILQHTNDVAEIEWFKNGKSRGTTKFTTEDMQRAKLGGDSWQKWPRQMRAARCVREGIDLFCSGVMQGPVNNGSDEDYEAACVAEITGEAVVEDPKPAPKKGGGGAKTAPTGATAPGAQAAPAATTPAPVSTPSPNPVVSVVETPKQESAPAASETSPPPSDLEPVDVDATPARPGQEAFGEILEAGLANGWTEESVNNWLVPFLSANEVDCSSMESLLSTWARGHVDSAINFVSSQKPEDANA